MTTTTTEDTMTTTTWTKTDHGYYRRSAGAYTFISRTTRRARELRGWAGWAVWQAVGRDSQTGYYAQPFATLREAKAYWDRRHDSWGPRRR